MAPRPALLFILSAFAAIDIPNDGKTLGVGRSTTEVGDLLAASGLPRERIELSIQPLLVKDGAHVLLFDTGAGNVPFPGLGHVRSAVEGFVWVTG